MCLLLSARAAAQPSATWESAARTTAFAVENDAGDSDKSYTNGIRLSTERLHRPQWGLLGRLFAGLEPCSAFDEFGNAGCVTTSFSIMQTMFTPRDIETRAAQPEDRPFAGLLAVGASMTRYRDFDSHRISVDMGVGGHLSLARETQSLAHWAWTTSAVRPQGWQHQLNPMLHVQVSSHRAFRWVPPAEHRVWSGDLSARTELTGGTVLGRGSLGGVARFGRNLPAWGGLDRIPISQPRSLGGGALGGRGASLRARTVAAWSRTTAYVFGSLDGRVVGWNTTLTGVPLIDSDQAKTYSPSSWIAEPAFGGSVGGPWGGVTFQRVFRSREFSTDDEWHRFWNLSVHLSRRQISR